MKIIVNFTENGVARPGLIPAISIRNITNISAPVQVITNQAMLDVGFGYYAYNFVLYTEQNEYIVAIDGGNLLTRFERYKYGSIDKIDVVDIPKKVWEQIMEGTYDAKDFMKIMASVLAAKSSGGGTNTLIYRNIIDTADKVVAIVDDAGNRSGVTLT